MHDFTKHLFAFCAAVLIAAGSFSAVATVPAPGTAQMPALMPATELA
ncbi:hypothetical protein [Citromicrobium bathyomarinum]